MPLDRLVLIAVLIVAAGGAAAVVAATFIGALAFWPAGVLILVPFAFVAYVIWRVVSERLGDPADRSYDNIEH